MSAHAGGCSAAPLAASASSSVPTSPRAAAYEPTAGRGPLRRRARGPRPRARGVRRSSSPSRRSTAPPASSASAARPWPLALATDEARESSPPSTGSTTRARGGGPRRARAGDRRRRGRRGALSPMVADGAARGRRRLPVDEAIALIEDAARGLRGGGRGRRTCSTQARRPARLSRFARPERVAGPRVARQTQSAEQGLKRKPAPRAATAGCDRPGRRLRATPSGSSAMCRLAGKIAVKHREQPPASRAPGRGRDAPRAPPSELRRPAAPRPPRDGGERRAASIAT